MMNREHEVLEFLLSWVFQLAHSQPDRFALVNMDVAIMTLRAALFRKGLYHFKGKLFTRRFR